MVSSPFSSLVVATWMPEALTGAAPHEVTVSVDPTLAAHRSVSLLRVDGGPTILAVTPDRASEFELVDGQAIGVAEVAPLLERFTITLNDPDNLFYLPSDEQDRVRHEARGVSTRQLTEEDAPAFESFSHEAPEEDLDEAFVELDHWLVFGTFVDGELACAASMYPWGETRLADLGVITLPRFRGRGLGRATVRAMSAVALDRGYEPQYRCQLDNVASVALARGAGFRRFGEWEVIVGED